MRAQRSRDFCAHIPWQFAGKVEGKAAMLKTWQHDAPKPAAYIVRRSSWLLVQIHSEMQRLQGFALLAFLALFLWFYYVAWVHVDAWHGVNFVRLINFNALNLEQLDHVLPFGAHFVPMFSWKYFNKKVEWFPV